MGNISGGMQTICEDIVKSYQGRIDDIRSLKKEANDLRENARGFVNDCKKLHKQMARDLKKGLKEYKEALIKDVVSLRADFRKKEKEIRSDLKEASKTWQAMNETLNSKRKPEKK